MSPDRHNLANKRAKLQTVINRRGISNLSKINFSKKAPLVTRKSSLTDDILLYTMYHYLSD